MYFRLRTIVLPYYSTEILKRTFLVNRSLLIMSPCSNGRKPTAIYESTIVCTMRIPLMLVLHTSATNVISKSFKTIPIDSTTKAEGYGN